MAAIPDHVLVARACALRPGRGHGTAARRARPSSAHDANADLDVAGIDGDVQLGAWDDALLDGVDLVVKSPASRRTRRR